MTEHVAEMVPNAKYDGLAIIDWERWDPVWERNWDSRKVYQTESIGKVRFYEKKNDNFIIVYEPCSQSGQKKNKKGEI